MNCNYTMTINKSYKWTVKRISWHYTRIISQIHWMKSIFLKQITQTSGEYGGRSSRVNQKHTKASWNHNKYHFKIFNVLFDWKKIYMKLFNHSNHTHSAAPWNVINPCSSPIIIPRSNICMGQKNKFKLLMLNSFD